MDRYSVELVAVGDVIESREGRIGQFPFPFPSLFLALSLSLSLSFSFFFVILEREGSVWSEEKGNS